MSLLDLLFLYVLLGAGCSAVVYARTRGSTRQRAGSAALALAVWPIWAPIVLIPDAPRRAATTGRAARIEDELEHAVRAAEGSPFEVLLRRGAAERIRDELRGAMTRIAELDEVLKQPGFDPIEAESRVSALSRGGNKRALKSAVLHRNNVARIQTLRDRHTRAIEELGELIGALRSQLVLARYAGSSPEGVGGIVTELWARVEGLGEAMDANDEVTRAQDEDEE